MAQDFLLKAEKLRTEAGVLLFQTPLFAKTTKLETVSILYPEELDILEVD
jgi:hypothetical protein